MRRGGLRHAVDGVLQAFATQRHMQVHFVVIMLVIGVGLWVRLGPLDIAMLTFAMGLVLVAEMMNSALEAWLDRQVDRYDQHVKIIKDIGAGAVLIAALTAALVGLLVFSSNVKVRELLLHSRMHPELGITQVMVLGLIAVLLLVVAIKERTRRGSLLRGGVISGHAALAWFLAMVMVVVSDEVPVQLGSVVLAFLVSQSRLQAGIHRVRDILLGALLGIGIAAFVVFARRL
jgi:diacylglycerol kinase (ATP)